VIHIERIKKELAWCMTYDQADTCRGASGRKLRQVCIWCQKYQKQMKKEKVRKDEKGA